MIYWISFSATDRNLGACIVEACSEMHAMEKTAALRINPGGEALIVDMTDCPEIAKIIADHGMDRLISREELMQNENVVFTKDASDEQIDDLIGRPGTTLICEEHNT